MKNDYLWDRTGEPDPEIQELEEVLGTLRYQPQPLELPAGIRPERQRRYFPPLAIAATIALLILAAGLWVRIHRSQTAGQNQTAKEQPPVTREKHFPPVNVASPNLGTGNQQLAVAVDKGAPKEIHIRNRKPPFPRDSFAAKATKPRKAIEPTAGLTAEQREQGVAAKEQLMLALRLASAKLNLAQRKSQGPPTPSTIRNQHKVG